LQQHEPLGYTFAFVWCPRVPQAVRKKVQANQRLVPVGLDKIGATQKQGE